MGSSLILSPVNDQEGFNSCRCSNFAFSLVRSRLSAESERRREGFVFQGDTPIPTPIKALGEGGGGEVEPFELMLDKELQLVDRLLEQLIERTSDVDRT